MGRRGMPSSQGRTEARGAGGAGWRRTLAAAWPRAMWNLLAVSRSATLLDLPTTSMLAISSCTPTPKLFPSSKRGECSLIQVFSVSIMSTSAMISSFSVFSTLITFCEAGNGGGPVTGRGRARAPPHRVPHRIPGDWTLHIQVLVLAVAHGLCLDTNALSPPPRPLCSRQRTARGPPRPRADRSERTFTSWVIASILAGNCSCTMVRADSHSVVRSWTTRASTSSPMLRPVCVGGA